MWPWINSRHLTAAATPSKPLDIPWMPCRTCVRPPACNMRTAASFLRASCPQYRTALHLVWAVSPALISHSGPKLLKALSAPASAGTLSTRLTCLMRLRDDKARIYSDSLTNLSQGYIIKQPGSVFFSFFCKLFGRRNLWRVFCQQRCTLILFQKVFYMFVSNILLIPTGRIIISSPHLHLRAKAKRSAIAEQLGVHVRWCLHFWRQELCLSVNSQIVLALLPCNNHVTEWIVFHVLSPHAAFLQHIYPVQK